MALESMALESINPLYSTVSDSNFIKESQVVKQCTAVHKTAKKVVECTASSQFTSAATGPADVMADNSYAARQTANNANFDSPTFQVAGMTTACNSATGALAFYNAILKRDHCAEIGYASGVTDNTIDAARGVFQGLGGLSFLAYRPTAAACMILSKDASSIHATSLLGKIAFFTGTIGAGLFGGFYFCISLYFGRILHRSYNFFASVEHNKSLKELRINIAEFAKDGAKENPNINLGVFLQEIYKQTNVSSNDVIDRLCDKYGVTLEASDCDSNVQDRDGPLCGQGINENQTLLNPQLKKLKNHLKKTAAEFKDKSVLFFKQSLGDLPLDQNFIAKIKNGEFDENELKTLIGLFNETKTENGDKHQAFIEKLDSEELLGLYVEIVKRQASRDAKVGDVIGSEALGMIKQSINDDLKTRLYDENDDIQALALEEVDKIIEAIQKERNFNFGVNFLLFISGVIGLVGTALGFMQQALALVVSGFIFQMCALIMLFADGAFLYRAMECSNGDVGKRDKLFLLAFQWVGILSLVCIIAIASVFSGGTVPLAIAITLGILWVFQTSGCIGLLARKERKNFTQMPTLEKLRTVLDEKNIREKDSTFWEKIGDFLWTCVGGQGTYTRKDIDQMITKLSESERNFFENVCIAKAEPGTLTKELVWDSVGLNAYHEYSKTQQVDEENETYTTLAGLLEGVYRDPVAFKEAVESLWKEDKADADVSSLYRSLKRVSNEAVNVGVERKLNNINQERLNYHIFKLKSKTLAQRQIEANSFQDLKYLKTIISEAIQEQSQYLSDAIKDRAVSVL